MKVLVLGASGATGKLVALQLINRQINVRIVVRECATLPEEILNNPLTEVTHGNISEFNDLDMENLVHGCNAIVSCLGHNITMKGMFGKPRNLVVDTVKKVCNAVKKNSKTRLILMSTTAFLNNVKGEKYSTGENIIFSILKFLLPPHLDNVMAANFLQTEILEGIGNIEWVAVRPDTLFNEEVESAYEACESPIRSPVFNPGKVSRLNVSHFMADLLTDDVLWQKWRFKMPVLYNKI